MKVALLKAKCADCAHEFAHPSLGDMAYGAFIFSGERSTVHAYFSAQDNPVWQFLESVLGAPAVGTKAAVARGIKLQTACAHFADPVEGQLLTTQIICPQCHSTKLAWWGSEKVGYTEMEHASFSQYMALPESDRRYLAVTYFETQLNK